MFVTKIFLFIFINIITASEIQSYELTDITGTNPVKDSPKSKKISLKKETVKVESTDNVYIEITESNLSFLQESTSLNQTLHSFRLSYKDKKVIFVHITVPLQDGSYPKTYADFKENVRYIQTTITDKNRIYDDKDFVLFFVEKKGFLKLPSGKYTLKCIKQRKSFGLQLKFLEIQKQAFFKKTDTPHVFGVELAASVNAFRAGNDCFFYGILYLTVFRFFEENGVFKPHPKFIHAVSSQKLAVDRLAIGNVLTVCLTTQANLRLKFEFERNEFILTILGISGFIETKEKQFDFYEYYSAYNPESSFPVKVFKALVPESSSSIGFFLCPTRLSISFTPTDYFTFSLIVNFSFETSEGIFGTNQIFIFVEVSNPKLFSKEKMVFEDQEIGDWLITIELSIERRFHDQPKDSTEIEIFVEKIFVNRKEATFQNVEMYGTGQLANRQEVISNPNSVARKVAEKLCLYVNNTQMQQFAHNKKCQNERNLLHENNKKLAQECNQLKEKLAKNESSYMNKQKLLLENNMKLEQECNQLIKKNADMQNIARKAINSANRSMLHEYIAETMANRPVKEKLHKGEQHQDD